MTLRYKIMTVRCKQYDCEMRRVCKREGCVCVRGVFMREMGACLRERGV